MLIGLLTAVVPGCWPNAAHGASGPEFFGTNLQTIGIVSDPARVREELAAGRMAVHRYEIRWHEVEATAPLLGRRSYDWSRTDRMIGAMAADGLRVAPLFRFSPAWAHQLDLTKPGGVDVLPPAAYDDYAALLVAFAARYGPGGEFWAERPALQPQPTLSYEVWNEPNLDQYAWNERTDPGAYAALLSVVRPAVKRQQPGALIVGGGLAWQQSGDGVHPEFVSELGRAGGLAQLDAIGFHPYAPDAQSTLDLVVGLRRELVAAGAPDLPIYANEAGQEAVVTNPDGTRVPDREPSRHGYERFPSDAARGANLALAGEILAASDCGVEQFLPYAAGGTEDNSLPLTEGYMGLFRRSGGAPTETALALQRASRRWAARFDAGGPGAPVERLAICRPQAQPADAALIQLPVRFNFVAAGCVQAQARYDGNPLESARLLLQGGNGALLAEDRTDAFGEAAACVPDWLRGQPFTAVVELRGAARSTLVRCDEPGAGCSPGAVVESLASEVSIGPTIARPRASSVVESVACSWSLGVTPLVFVRQRGREAPKLAVARVRRSGPGVGTQRLRLLAACSSEPATARLRVELTVRRHGQRQHRRIAVLRPVNGRARSVFVAGLRRGDRLAVVARAAAGQPAAERRVVVVGAG